MWTASCPARLIASTTKCTVSTSRRLPRWIGPDGLIPEAQTIVWPGPLAASACPIARAASASNQALDVVAGFIAIEKRVARYARPRDDRTRSVRASDASEHLGSPPRG